MKILLIPLFIAMVSFLIRFKKIEKMIPFINDCESVLDVGSGDGCYSMILRLLGRKVVPIDVVDKSICCRPIMFNGSNIPLDDKSVDCSLCLFVLHHTKNQKQLLDEMSRVSRKYVFIMEDILEEESKKYIEKHSKSDWGSCLECFHSLSDWEFLFISHGFDIKLSQEIPWWEMPFSMNPIWYPIRKQLFILVPLKNENI